MTAAEFWRSKRKWLAGSGYRAETKRGILRFAQDDGIFVA